MRVRNRNNRFPAVILVSLLLLIGLAPPAFAAKGKLWKKQWLVTVTAPDSASGNQFGVRRFTVKARSYDAAPSPLPLRQLTATPDDGAAVQGVWRQDGNAFSMTFELPCAEGSPCGTVILRGSFSSRTEMNGQAIIMWDTPDLSNVAGFETVNGSFQGVRQ